MRGRWLLALLLFFALVPTATWAEDAPAPGPGKVTLPLREYLTLIEKVESLDRERERENARRETPLAEVVAQRLAVSVSERAEADLAARYEALVQGRPKEPLLLPFRGFAARAEVRSLAGAVGLPAVSAGKGGDGLLLVAPAPGRYEIEV